MRYRIGTPLIAFNGKPILETPTSTTTSTLGRALITALIQADTSKRRDQKVEMYQLVKRIYDAEHKLAGPLGGTADREIELSGEDVLFLRTLVSEVLPIAVMGPVLDLLDHPIQPPAENTPLTYDDFVKGSVTGRAKQFLAN